MQIHDSQNDNRKTLGQKIREARLKLGLTQSELADGMVTTSMISQIEADKAKPSYDLLKAISQQLRVDVSFFMNDADETSQIAMKLRIAEYQTLAKNGEKALEILQSIDLNLLHASDYDDYLLMMARAKRLTGEPQDALAHLERLREIAFRKDDAFLFLKLYKESGYLEYAMKNYDAAIMEWKNAVWRGESILQGSLMPHSETRSTLREIYIGLAKATQKLAVVEATRGEGTNPSVASQLHLTDNAEAREYLSAASKLAPPQVRLRDVADSYAEDAVRCLEHGDVRSIPRLVDNATAILQASSHAQEQILLEAFVCDTADVWDSAATSLAASHPDLYFEAELAHAQQLLKAKQYGKVEGHLTVVKSRIIAWNEAGYLLSGEIGQMMSRLEQLRADSFRDQGEIAQAVDILESFTDSPHAMRLGKDAAKVFARLIEWNVELGRAEKITHWIERLERVLKHKDPALADKL